MGAGTRLAVLCVLSVCARFALAGDKQHKHGAEVAAWVRQDHTHAQTASHINTVDEALASIVKYYEGDDRLVKEALRLRTAGFAEALDAKLARYALSAERQKLVIACLGSSVTAGHDGFGSTAYPAVLERTLQSALNHLGVDVEVRNLAVGGREPYPASLCVSTICGNDADIVVREWEYWSFDDGLEEDKPTRHPEEGAVEVFLRAAASLDSRPAVFFMNVDVEGNSGKTRDLLALFAADGKLGSRYAATEGVGVFSAFGVAFDGLRAAAPTSRTDRSGSKSCKGKHVGDCPVDLAKPDGHHGHAEWDGFDPAEHEELLPFARPGKLFVNWHPGAIGHEVMGKQLAFHVLQSLKRGLLEVQRGSTHLHGRSALPKASHSCDTVLCARSSPPWCAMATLPKAAGPDLGDVIDNSTQVTKWPNVATENLGMCPDGWETKFCGKERRPADICYDKHRKCSYHDQKRGYAGDAATGPLNMKIPLNNVSVLYFSETTHSWGKPVHVANWHHELAVEVEGVPCTPETCRVAQGSGQYVQNLRIDLAAMLPKLRTLPHARVTMRVTPVESLESYERDNEPICQVARNKKCEPFGTWRRYELKCSKTPEGSPLPCVLDKKARPADKVKAYISSVLAY